MVSQLFYYQLALLILVWLFIMLHIAESRREAPIPLTATPIKPKRPRSNEPQPFVGLTHKPHCALCERATTHPKPPSPVPPDPMALTNRRPREIDTSQHFCPYVAGRGVSSIVRRATATFWRPMAPSSTANRRRWSSSLGCLNRPSAIDRFLDSSRQSRFSHVRWPNIFNHTRGLRGPQMRPLLIFTTR